MADSPPTIIITGGSISLEYDENILTGAANRRANTNKRITKVLIKDANGAVLHDYAPTGGRCKIEIYTQ